MSYCDEIGSEFWDVPLRNDWSGTKARTLLEKRLSEYRTTCSFFLSGRAALGAVIDDAVKRRGISSILVPAYCCESMLRPIEARGLDVSFYSVTGESGQGITCDYDLPEADAVLLVDYFGFYETQRELFSGSDIVVIRDLTHSFFSVNDFDWADYSFGSLRKWAGFYTGGVVWTKEGALCPRYSTHNPAYINLRRLAMEQKSEYIAGATSSKEFLSIFRAAEEMLDDEKVPMGAERDVDFALRLDSNFIQERRLDNVAFLFQELGELALFPKIGKGKTPLFFPIMVDSSQRDELQRYLASQGIYCPVHWPAPNGRVLPLAKNLYEQELSVICDQRYDIEDMERVASAILSFWRH